MNKYFRKIQLMSLIVLLAPALFLTSCNDDDDLDPQRNIVEVINTDPDFSILRAIIDRAGLATALSTGALTVFAPNNTAFQAAGLTEADVETITPAVAAAVLQYHVVDGRQTAADLPAGTNTAVPTLANSPVYVTKTGSDVFVNGARVVTADIGANNGIIHEIDGVLNPPLGDIVTTALAYQDDLSFLIAAIQRASTGTTDVAQVLAGAGPYTVFAPTNEAFISTTPYTTIEAINAANPDDLARILTYHVVPGRVYSSNLANGNVATVQGGNVVVNLGTGVQVTGAGNSGNPANVILPNITATNGVIHAIDRVLLPAN